MLRPVAIFLILVLLMNIVGSYGLLARLESSHVEHISQRLTQGEFAGSEAITLKLPMSLPYPMSHSNYENVAGNFEYEGQVYRLVRQKHFNDTLYVVCVQDTRSSKLKGAFKDLASSFVEHQAGDTSNSKVFSFIAKDFEQSQGVHVSDCRPETIDLHQIRDAFSARPAFPSSIDQPPRV